MKKKKGPETPNPETPSAPTTATVLEASAKEELAKIVEDSKLYFNEDGTPTGVQPEVMPEEESEAAEDTSEESELIELDNKEKRPSQQAIMEILVDHMNGGASGEAVFGRRYPWKTLYHVEVSPEGTRQVLLELPGKVLRYVNADMVSSEIYKFTHRLPRTVYKHYKVDMQKVRKIYDYWLMTKDPLKDPIHPVLQKDTPGYCFHRFDFNMEDKPTEIFDYIMGGIGHNREAVLAFIGSMFDSKSTLQQYCWLIGPGGDGKGSLFRILKQLFADAYVGITTEKNQLDKYWASSLLGKRLAVCGDTRNLDFINESIFMAITGGDAVAVRSMRKSAYSAHLPCLFMLGANAYPNINSGGASFRRAIIATFTRKEEDKVWFENFEARLWEERAGILFKCWAEWKKMRHLHRIPVDTARLMDHAADTEEDFQVLFDSYFDLRTDGFCTAMEVKQSLDKEKFPMSSVRIGAWKRWLTTKFGIKAKDQVVVDGQRTRVYPGMCLRGSFPSNIPLSQRREEEF